MFKTSLRVAWRNLLKDRQFTLLNLLGLSTGLTCVMLIFLWVQDERQVDQFNEKDSQLFQVMRNSETANGIETGEQTPGLLAASLASELPEVAYATAVIPVSWFDKKGLLVGKDRTLAASNQFVGKDYFHLFTYRFIAGHPDQALADKSSIVITRDLALKMFHTTDQVLGKTVEWNQKDYSGVYRISGIVESPPANATLQFDVAFSYALFLEKNPNLQKWSNNNPSTYVLVKPGTDLAHFNQKIAGFIKSKHAPSKATLFTQKFSDRYLYGHYANGAPDGGRIEAIHLFSVIAFFILLIACINFMNLSTAKAARRVREAGVKKVLGAQRFTLVVQYLGESLLLTFLSAIIATLFVLLLLPLFNQLTGKQLQFSTQPALVLAMPGIILATGILAGSYPAFYLSGFKPATILKGKFSNSLSELLVRKGLVVFQFTLSVILIVSVLVVHRQLRLIQTKNLGYNRDNLLYFEKGGLVPANKADYAPGGPYETSLQQLLLRVKNTPGVVNATNFRHNITNRNGGTYDLSWQGKDPAVRIDFTDLAVGYDFIETTGIKVKAGRAFSSSYGAEKSNIIFNEAAIEVMGLKDPIGKTVQLWGQPRQIIGVVENFNFQSLHENLTPCFLDLTVNQWASKIMVKLQAGQEKETINRLEALYRAYNPGQPFEYRFLDADYQALYVSEQKVAALSTWFAALAILLSCLGLFGLAAFTAQRRQKEIGIRKVVGASARQVVYLLSKDFLQLTGIALLIAFPLSWWVMSRWLHGFAYRIDLRADVFLIAGVATVLLTLLSVGFQSIQAALSNPVKSLREG